MTASNADTPAVAAMYVPMPLNAAGDGPADPAETVRVEHQVWDAETCGTLCTAADEAVARHIVSLWNGAAAPVPDLAIREAVARVIDPDVWTDWGRTLEAIPNLHPEEYSGKFHITRSLATADRVLSLLRSTMRTGNQGGAT